MTSLALFATPAVTRLGRDWRRVAVPERMSPSTLEEG